MPGKVPVEEFPSIVMQKPKDKLFWIQLPKRDNEGHPIDPKYLKKYVDQIEDRFNGYTMIPSVFGCAENNEGEEVCDESLLVLTGRDLQGDITEWDEQLKSDYQFMEGLAGEAAKEFGQWGVMQITDSLEDIKFIGDDSYKKRIDKRKQITEFESIVKPRLA